VSACVPVPDGQEFRISIVDSRDYLTGSDGGNLPVSSDGSTLITTPDYSQAIPFRAAPGKNGQITLLNADGTTLYSDQDLTGSGDEPIYFDTLQTSEDSSMYPVQFCLQPDNTFVVQNLGTQDPNDDANIVQICPDDGAVYLHTAAAAAIRGCTTVRLQIVDARPAITTSTSSASGAAPTATIYKEGRFRVRMAAPGIEGYMTNFDSGVGKAVPDTSEANFATISDESLAVIFETVPGQSGLVVLYNVNNEALYLNRDRNPGGPVYVNTQASITENEYIQISLFVRQDNTIIVQNLGQDAADPADDSSAILLCPDSRGPIYQMYAANNPAIPSDCVAQTLIAEFVVPAVSSTSTSTSVPSPTPPPYVPPVGCPESSVQIPDRYVFGTYSSTTTDMAQAYIFTTSPAGTGQITTTDGSNYDSQFVPYLSDNSGYSFFYRNADISTQGWKPLQFCLQPDNTFNVHSVGADGPGFDDATITITCLNQNERQYFDNGDNVAAFAGSNCFVDTLVYEPVV
jgi:hypothetical protein